MSYLRQTQKKCVEVKEGLFVIVLWIVSYLYVVNKFFLLCKFNIFFPQTCLKRLYILLTPWVNTSHRGTMYRSRGASCRETPFIGVLYARYVQDAVSEAKHCSQLYNFYLCVVSSSLFLFIAWHVVRIEDIEGGSLFKVWFAVNVDIFSYQTWFIVNFMKKEMLCSRKKSLSKHFMEVYFRLCIYIC